MKMKMRKSIEWEVTFEVVVAFIDDADEYSEMLVDYVTHSHIYNEQMFLVEDDGERWVTPTKTDGAVLVAWSVKSVETIRENWWLP